MLSELRIKNYAVIDDLSLRLEPGLGALTGETGAGKSIIVGALSLVLGERASADVIRAGEDRATVEATFDISERQDLQQRCRDAGIDVGEGWLVLKREVNAAGRSRAWINGSPATASLTGEFGQALIELHGQHEHQALLHAGPQRSILDAYGGATEMAGKLRTLWSQLSDLQRQRSALEERRARTEERAGLLRNQADEIAAAEIREPDEDLTLAEEERKLAHAEELLERASGLHDAVYSSDGAVYDRVGSLRRELDSLAKIDPSAAAKFSELFDTAYYTLQELGERLGSYRESIDLDPAALERVRARFDLLFRLKSKYGPTLTDVIESGSRAHEELEALDTAGFELEELVKREEELTARLAERAATLGRARAVAAKSLAAEVTAIFPELGLPDGRLEIVLNQRPQVEATGAEDVEFQVVLNRGFEPRALSKVASGGELSRVMLAVKTILARLDRTPTLIFDEIDSGIGGIVAQKVAERLKTVARHHQVFVITHLPQIAALADHHLFVKKESKRNMSATRVSELSGDERVRDIARMLGGDPERQASIEHARTLLATAERGAETSSRP